MIDCKKCKFACKDRDWYSYGEIRFCRLQMIWLIEHIEELSDGNWPVDPKASSYIDEPMTSKSFVGEAYFARPSGILAEIMARLNRTGEDGVTLMEDIQSGIDRYSELKSVAKRALNYISGWRRRKTSYTDWKSKRKGRKDYFPIPANAL